MKNKKTNHSKPKKNLGGRPPLYKSTKELQDKIDEYFNTEAWVNIGVGKKLKRYQPTIMGLVIFLGFCDRASFYKLEENPRFLHTIKKARSKIEQFYERLLQGANSTGAIFALKNFGWKDRFDIENSGEIKYTQMPVIKRNGKPVVFNVGK